AERCRDRAALYHALVTVAGNLSFNTAQLACDDPAAKSVHAVHYPDQRTRKALNVSLPYEDADGDWLPDAWERANGLDSNDAADAMADYDGDGLAHVGEYLANSDPLERDSDGNGIDDLMEMLITGGAGDD
ncbi:MAG: hypothetical protein WD873_03795, partial [Candidatus Hydrogenedentales bacterium]